MRVLFTTPVLEHPAAGGPQLRIENSLKALARVCDLTVIYRCRGTLDLDPAALAFYKSLCGDFVAHEYSGLSPNRYLRKFQRLVGIDAIHDADNLIRHADRTGATIMWFGYGNISFPLIRRIRALRPDLRLVCDTDSVWSRYVLRELPYAQGLRRLAVARAGTRKEHEEREWVKLCDVTTAVSEVDAEYYRAIAAEPDRIHVFSNVIDLATYCDPPPPPPGLKRPAIYLAGTFQHPNSPMDQAARWLIDEILPLVRASIPDVHLYLVGKNSDRQFGHLADPGITVTGRLPSVLPHLCHIDIAVVPLRFESGTRFKILEAGACGIPLVSTTLGAEGLPVVDGEHLLLADDTAAFAHAVVRLIEDRGLAARLGANCRQLIRRDYSIDTLERQARKILSYIETK